MHSQIKTVLYNQDNWQPHTDLILSLFSYVLGSGKNVSNPTSCLWESISIYPLKKDF